LLFLKKTHNYAAEIRFFIAKGNRYTGPRLSSTDYADAVLVGPIGPTFNQSPLYKHFFSNFSGQIDTLKLLSVQDRFNTAKTSIKFAIENL